MEFHNPMIGSAWLFLMRYLKERGSYVEYIKTLRQCRKKFDECLEKNYALRKSVIKPSDILNLSFVWKDSSAGYSYWFKIYQELIEDEEFFFAYFKRGDNLSQGFKKVISR